MHRFQKELLSRLIEENELTYSRLVGDYAADENIVFHLKQLIKKEYIEKRDNKYYITPKGISITTSFHQLSLVEEGAKEFMVGFIFQNENNEFLLKSHKGFKSPFYNLPSGKPFRGENMGEALVRLFALVTGVDLDSTAFHFDSLHVKTITTKDGDVLFDDAFAVYKVDDAKAIDELDIGEEYEWSSTAEIKKMKAGEKWPEIDICLLRKGWKPYLEYSFVSNYVLADK
ncbi:MAG: hypothetical protein ACE5DX_06075 [Candidatus Dojkabacteria bacterium]